MAKNDLINDILRYQRNAERKLLRFKQQGVSQRKFVKPDILPAAKLKTLNMTQLKKHADGLKSFNSVSNNFVQLANGSHVHRSKWAEYKKAERLRNDRIKHMNQRLKKVASSNPAFKSLAEERDLLVVKHPVKGLPSPVGYYEFRRSPKQVNSEDALEKLTKAYKFEASAEGRKKKAASFRSSIEGMIQMVAPELMNVVQDLSDDQVIALWSLDPNFARALKMNYDIVMEWLSGGEEAVIEAYNTEAFRQNVPDIVRQLDWVQSAFPKNKSGRKTSKRKTKRRR